MIYKKLNNLTNINKVLNNISFKKQYIKKLNNINFFLKNNNENNYKILNTILFISYNFKTSYNNFITYIVDILFSKTNTFLHIINFSGKLKTFFSVGFFKYKGKDKKSKFFILKNFYYLLLTKVKFIKDNPVALHMKNLGYHKFWIIKKLKKRIFIKIIQNYNLYSYNGCRRKKLRRKKLNKKKELLSGSKRQIVNLLSFLIAGSNPASFK